MKDSSAEKNKRKQVEDVRLNREGKKEQEMAASSSPSHEFSFSVSVQTSSSSSSSSSSTDKTKPFTTLDLSPADEIFFHGHLLPLHLLSHLPPTAPSRSSTNFIESYTNKLDPNKQKQPNSKSDQEKETKVKQLKRKLRFNLTHVLKRYARMVKPLLQFRVRRDHDRMQQLHRQSYSFSGNLSFRKKSELRGRRGGFSAPVSMRTSPTNSGVLLPAANNVLPPSTNDSTMEELHAAIQAAIAHCKNSILKQDTLKS